MRKLSVVLMTMWSFIAFPFMSNAAEVPSFTGCGSKWYQRFGLQLLEIEQAMRGGYSFDVACQAHDACYGDCKTPRNECDKRLRLDAQAVCDSARNIQNCLADAQIFFQAVSDKGDKAFNQARASCQVPTPGYAGGVRSAEAIDQSNDQPVDSASNTTSRMTGQPGANFGTAGTVEAATGNNTVNDENSLYMKNAGNYKKSLNKITGYERYKAIVSIVRNIPSKQTSHELAKLFGSDDELNEWHRSNTITEIARLNKYDILGVDATDLLNGTTGYNRSKAIIALVPFFKPTLSAQELSNILGTTTELKQQHRVDAIKALVRSGKVGILNSNAKLILQGTTGYYRQVAISLIKSSLVDDLSPEEITSILGGESEIGSHHRSNAIQILVDSSTKSSIKTINGCNAPPTAIRLVAPTCQQLWSTHLFRKIALAHFIKWEESINHFEKASLTADKLLEQSTYLGELLVTAFNGPNNAAKVAEIIYEGNGTLLSILPIDDPAGEIAIDAVDTMREGISTSISHALRGSASFPYAKTINLANKIAALWGAKYINRERNTKSLTMEYLRQLYMFGGDQKYLAKAYGLSENSNFSEILSSINQGAFRYSINPAENHSYSHLKVAMVVNSWENSLNKLALHYAAQQ